MSVDLNESNERVGSTADRALRLVRAGKLPATCLASVGGIRFRGELLVDALQTIVGEVSERPKEAIVTALDILGQLAWSERRPLPGDQRTQEVIWRVLELAVDGARAHEHVWRALVRRMSVLDLDRAVRLLCKAAVTGDYQVADDAVEELIVHATSAPDMVLAHVGPMLLSEETCWRFAVRGRAAFFQGIPAERLERWLKENGAPAALAVAAHLEPPRIDASGAPVVPRVTAFVLQTFEDDQDVFERFCSSVHSGKIYGGDIAGQHDDEARVAEQFLTHPLRRIREWAVYEESSSRAKAAFWREHREERFAD